MNPAQRSNADHRADRLVAPDIPAPPNQNHESRIETRAREAARYYTLAYRGCQLQDGVEFVCENNREYVDSNGAVRLRLP
jgi:hypothetical protein